MNDLVRQEPLGDVVDTFARIIEQVVGTDFVPRSFRGNKPATLACMLYGRELGLEPMQSLRMMDLILGTPALKPEAMRALVRQAGHTIWFDQKAYTDKAVTIHGHRREDPEGLVVSATFTWEDAERAKLTGKDSWKQYPRAMLAARATSELCRTHFPDVIGGLSYTPEEAEDFGSAPVVATAPVVPAGSVTVAPSRDLPAVTQLRAAPQVELDDAVVTVAAGKKRLLQAYVDAGMDPEAAKGPAHELWFSKFGSSRYPVFADDVDGLVAFVTSQVVDEPPFDGPDAA